MLKRVVSLLLCGVLALFAIPFSASTPTSVSAEGIEFGDRILYGGTAVDVGDDTVFSENGALWRVDAAGNRAKLAEIDAKYLNYSDGRIYFISNDRIMSINPDGSGVDTVHRLKSEAKCLYVVENGMLYMRGDCVYSMQNGREELLLCREGMAGFVPEPDGSIRWVKENPDYIYIEENGDEVWTEGGEEYLQYVAEPNSAPEDDLSYTRAEVGTPMASGSDYSGPYVEVGSVTLPLSYHMPGTFFSKNGQACTCHHTSSTYCIQSVGNCNCMRYYPTGKKETCEVDLLGAQCFSFARMVFWTCFGFIDHSANSSLYYNVGTLSSGAVTANSVKSLLMSAAPGAHVRLAAGHSVSILTMDEDFIVIYHGNAGGDGVVSQPCVISTRRYTWEQFATAAAKGILYVNMPINYPDSKVVLTKKEVGYYKLKANLNLREEANTATDSLAVIPNGTIIEVDEVDGFWGKTEYYGKSGWVFLEYTTFYSRMKIDPSGELFTLGEDGYLRAAAWKMSFDSFSEYFDKQSITVSSSDGTDLSASGYIGTGSVVTLAVQGNTVDSATVCLAGDVNGNGLLDVGDYILAKRAYLGTVKLNSVQSAAVDVSGSGGLDVLDYLLIRRYFFNPDPTFFKDFGA